MAKPTTNQFVIDANRLLPVLVGGSQGFEKTRKIFEDLVRVCWTMVLSEQVRGEYAEKLMEHFHLPVQVLTSKLDELRSRGKLRRHSVDTEETSSSRRFDIVPGYDRHYLAAAEHSGAKFIFTADGHFLRRREEIAKEFGGLRVFDNRRCHQLLQSEDPFDVSKIG